MPFRQLVFALVWIVAIAAAPQAQVEARLSGTSALLGEGDTIGLLLGLHAETPIVSLTSPSAPVNVDLQMFGSVAGLRTGSDFYKEPEDAGTTRAGYGQRTLLMGEAGVALCAGWVRVAVGPSVRYRDESFVRTVRYNFETDELEKTVISSERSDIGGGIEFGVRLPVTETAAMGVHASLRRYNAGTQMAGLGLSASIGL